MPVLYDHQQRIVTDDPKKTGLFLGTGSGKTRTALILAKDKTLIVCPKTQFEDENWPRELQRINDSPMQFVNQVRSISVISKEKFRSTVDEVVPCDTLIVDEAHTVLGVTPNTRFRKKVEIPKASQLFEALEAYIERVQPSRIYLATATIMRSPMTVWAAAKVLGRLDLTGDFFTFRREFYTKLPMPGRQVYVAKSDSATKDKLAKIVRQLGYVGRLEDFFDVPEQTFRTDYVELTAKQKARIKEMRTEYPEPIVRVGKKHQIENGVLAGDEFNAPESFENAKTAKILEYAMEFPRMVVFAKYSAQIAAIQEALTKAGYFTWTLTGETKDRGGVIKQANEMDGILICQAQISAGWELPNTPVMIFASRTHSFVDYDQALGRIQRANAIKKNLYIHLVVKGGVDDAVDKSLQNKCDFNERIYSEQDV